MDEVPQAAQERWTPNSKAFKTPHRLQCFWALSIVMCKRMCGRLGVGA